MSESKLLYLIWKKMTKSFISTQLPWYSRWNKAVFKPNIHSIILRGGSGVPSGATWITSIVWQISLNGLRTPCRHMATLCKTIQVRGPNHLYCGAMFHSVKLKPDRIVFISVQTYLLARGSCRVIKLWQKVMIHKPSFILKTWTYGWFKALSCISAYRVSTELGGIWDICLDV